MAITINGKPGVTEITELTVGSSADLASIISDESGTGVLAFTTSPTLTTPVISSITNGGTLTLPVGTLTLATTADVAVGMPGGVTETGTQTLTNKTLTTPIISSISNTGTLTLPTSTGTLALTTDIPAGTVTETGTQTLTNKTLTSPVLGGTTTSASGNIVVKPASNILEVQGDAVSVVGQIQLNCHVNTHGQKIASQPHSEAATNKLTLPGGTTIGNTDAVLVSDIGTQTITNKTLTSPTVNTATIAGGTLADAVIRGLEEDVNVVAAGATGTINFNIETASIWYYTTNATANHTLNFRFSSSVSLNTALAVGDAITVVWLNTNGATAYYPNVINIDGSAVTPKAPAAISSGNASAIDAYSFTIIKTASATFTVLETQTKFA